MSGFIYDGKPVKRFTWVKDAALTYSATEPGTPPALTDTHEYDAVLHAWVEFSDGETREWSDDWGKGLPDWASDLIDAATD